jgi:hypothetical protein
MKSNQHREPWSKEEFPRLPRPDVRPADELATQAVAVAENNPGIFNGCNAARTSLSTSGHNRLLLESAAMAGSD